MFPTATVGAVSSTRADVGRRRGHHAVRRYPTVRPHTWVVVDYLVAHDHLRVFFKTRCTWSIDGVDCHPGATS